MYLHCFIEFGVRRQPRLQVQQTIHHPAWQLRHVKGENVSRSICTWPTSPLIFIRITINHNKALDYSWLTSLYASFILLKSRTSFLTSLDETGVIILYYSSNLRLSYLPTFLFLFAFLYIRFFLFIFYHPYYLCRLSFIIFYIIFNLFELLDEYNLYDVYFYLLR